MVCTASLFYGLSVLNFSPTQSLDACKNHFELDGRHSWTKNETKFSHNEFGDSKSNLKARLSRVRAMQTSRIGSSGVLNARISYADFSFLNSRGNKLITTGLKLGGAYEFTPQISGGASFFANNVAAKNNSEDVDDNDYDHLTARLGLNVSMTETIDVQLALQPNAITAKDDIRFETPQVLYLGIRYLVSPVLGVFANASNAEFHRSTPKVKAIDRTTFAIGARLRQDALFFEGVLRYMGYMTGIDEFFETYEYNMSRMSIADFTGGYDVTSEINLKAGLSYGMGSYSEDDGAESTENTSSTFVAKIGGMYSF